MLENIIWEIHFKLGYQKFLKIYFYMKNSFFGTKNFLPVLFVRSTYNYLEQILEAPKV